MRSHLPKSRTSNVQLSSVEIVIVVFGILALGLCFHSMTKYFVSKDATHAMNEPSTIRKTRIGVYPIRIRTRELAEYLPRNTKVSSAALFLGKRPLYKENNPKTLDRIVFLPAGEYVLTLKIWDYQKHEFDKNFVLLAGSSLTPSRQVASLQRIPRLPVH